MPEESFRDMRFLYVLIALLGHLEAANGQATISRDTTSIGIRSLALTAGFGNLYGGYGVSGEKYVARGAVSVSAGIGGFRSDNGSGFTSFSLALRGYSGGLRNRAFLEASLTLVAWRNNEWNGRRFEDVRKYYGPGLSTGYHYTGTTGFTFVLDVGVAWEPVDYVLAPILSIGIGHTWR